VDGWFYWAGAAPVGDCGSVANQCKASNRNPARRKGRGLIIWINVKVRAEASRLGIALITHPHPNQHQRIGRLQRQIVDDQIWASWPIGVLDYRLEATLWHGNKKTEIKKKNRWK
jgi:hypothetical protein